MKKTNAIPYTTIEEYVKLNPDMSAQHVIDIWRPFKKCSMRTWIVCGKEEHDEMEQKYANYSYEIVCGDGNSLWVNKDGWMYHPKILICVIQSQNLFKRSTLQISVL